MSPAARKRSNGKNATRGARGKKRERVYQVSFEALVEIKVMEGSLDDATRLAGELLGAGRWIQAEAGGLPVRKTTE